MRRFFQLVLAAALAAAVIPHAHAAERVVLANGFSLTCYHHSTVDGRVRLYTSSDTQSYIDFHPADITSIETLPDPPPEPAAEPATVTLPSTESGNTKLTPGDLHRILSDAGQAHNLDVDLLASVVNEESGGNARAHSRAGARGLMQLMPATAAELGVEDSYQPKENVQGGTAYLDELLTRYHDNLALALAAFNAGPAAVDKYHGVPPFHATRAYVARVIHEFNRRVLARKRASGTLGAQASR